MLDRANTWKSGSYKTAHAISIIALLSLSIGLVGQGYIGLQAANAETCTPQVVSSLRAIGSDGNLPKNTLDNSPNTRWSNLGVGSWIDYDLGQKKAICHLDIDWYRGQYRVNSFVISASLDGVVYSDVFSGKSDGKTLQWERFDFTDVEARYVKITVNGNTENKWASISEVSIFGYPAGTQTPLPTPTPPPTNEGTNELDIVITYPTAGSTIKGTITAVATVSGNVNVQKIDGFLDSTFIRTELYEPYEFKIDTTKFADGPHKFKATATGSSALTATAEINITIQNQISPPQQPPSIPPPTPLPSNGALPTAEQVYTSETFNVPDYVHDFIILIPNEAHEPTAKQLISSTNGHYLPANLIISKETSIIMLSNDAGHTHVTQIKRADNGFLEWKSNSIGWGGYTSPAKKLSEVTNYVISSTSYSDMKGTISTRNAGSAPSNVIAGAIYVPQSDLSGYKSLFTSNGFTIESEYNFTWQNSNNAVKSHTLIIYSTTQPLSSALADLSTIVKETPYD